MFNPLSSLVCSCITPYSDLIRLALYFKKISFSALSGSSRAQCSVMTPPAQLKRRSELAKRTEHYPVEISGTSHHFGRNRSRNRIRKNGRISSQPEPDIRYVPTAKLTACLPPIMQQDYLTLISFICLLRNWRQKYANDFAIMICRGDPRITSSLHSCLSGVGLN